MAFHYDLPDAWSTLPDLSFPQLQSLSIYCDYPVFFEYVATQWAMPRLANLFCREGIPMPLIAAHGKQLTYLHCTYSYWYLRYMSPNTDLLPRLHELCPRISHLVLRLSSDDRAALNINSPTLRYLDFLAKPSVSAYHAIALASTSHAPQLTKVRMVMAPCDFIPLLLHPSHVPGSDHPLEDLSDIPGMHESNDRADWLMSTTGGIEAWCPEGLMRQHAWAVVLDERCEGTWTSHPGAVGDPRVPDDDETDSEGVYEYESLPTSPVESDEDEDGSDGDDTGAGDGDDDCEMADRDGCLEDGADSDMEREWFEVEPENPPYPNKVAFVDDPLDSSRGQYDRETVLERFSQGLLGDFLLE